MILIVKSKKIVKHWILVLYFSLILQSLFTVFACWQFPTPEYTFIETKGFGGDCYARIVYPNHDSYDGVRTEVYESRDALEPVIVFPKEHDNIVPYCNRVLNNQTGIVTISLGNWFTNEVANAISFYVNDALKTMYLDLNLLIKGVELQMNPWNCGPTEYLVWDSSIYANSLEISEPDEFGRRSIIKEFKNDHISIVDGREVLSLLAIDQSILVFDLLTGQFIERKVP